MRKMAGREFKNSKIQNFKNSKIQKFKFEFNFIFSPSLSPNNLDALSPLLI